ncbi:hypothetical protein SeMB42_g06123 [Synchytrium endobioticum]|uniref:SAC3/GANP/THP3 conserved domain-containing protein n=1 Tax=Synchytrium endobioticum TaxID=286115 RepID=A0A507CM82_9FUNG|nr:hypothetical protein SeMB42_g06123 [Synchytrium endobioticum]
MSPLDRWNQSLVIARQDDISLVSRGQNNRLHSRQHQLQLFTRLHTNPANYDDDALLFAYRALREGILSSHQTDEFAVKVYEASIDACIRVIPNKAVDGARQELFRALNGLMNIYLELNKESGATEYANMTQQAEWRGKLHNVIDELPPSVMSGNDMRVAMNVWKAIRYDVDYVSLAQLVSAVSKCQRLFLEDLMMPLRRRVLQILRKAYYKLDQSRTQHYLMYTNDDEFIQFCKDNSLLVNNNLVQFRAPKS